MTIKDSFKNIFSPIAAHSLPPSKLLMSMLFELLFMRRCCFFLMFGVSAFIDKAVLLLLVGMEEDRLSESISCFSPDERNQSVNELDEKDRGTRPVPSANLKSSSIFA